MAKDREPTAPPPAPNGVFLPWSDGQACDMQSGLRDWLEVRDQGPAGLGSGGPFQVLSPFKAPPSGPLTTQEPCLGDGHHGNEDFHGQTLGRHKRFVSSGCCCCWHRQESWDWALMAVPSGGGDQAPLPGPSLPDTKAFQVYLLSPDLLTFSL